MCKTFGVKNPKISENKIPKFSQNKTALQQPKPLINKEDAALSCVILLHFK